MKRIATALLLMLIPVIAVNAVKETHWGPLLSTPASRQFGDPNAKVTLVEYSDFQCPSCAKMQPPLQDFLALYKGRIRVMYKFFPLTKIHKNSMSSAQAAQCAAEQNLFWPYEDRLFARQEAWAPLQDPTTHYMAIAEEVHLDTVRFTRCLNDPTKTAAIQEDMAEGRGRQVNATPTFFINEERVVGAMFASDGARLIEKELRK